MPSLNFHEQLTNNSEFLKRFATSLTHNGEDARDLYQETMYRAIANKDKYKNGTNLGAWLRTIMKNLFINSYRIKKKQQILFDYSVNDYLLDSHPHVEAGKADEILLVKEIYHIIDQLPDIFRSSFLLYVRGYKYREIADLTNEPLGTIKSRVHFARKMLKSRIDRQE